MNAAHLSQGSWGASPQLVANLLTFNLECLALKVQIWFLENRLEIMNTARYINCRVRPIKVQKLVLFWDVALPRAIPTSPNLISARRMIHIVAHCCAVLVFLMVSVVHGAKVDDRSAVDSWPHWRGPLATGISESANPPIEWSETKNIRWKTALPGTGLSSPIVWGDRVFLTAAVPFGDAVDPVYSKAEGAHDNLPVTQDHRFVVLAVGRRDGEILWQRTVRTDFPKEGGHNTGSLASNSPVTDGKHVYAFFGSRGLYCLDLNGTLKWKKDLGEMQTRHAHGEGSSPVLHGDTLVVNWDHEGQSYLFAFDKTSGEQLWKVQRDEMTSWSSPIVVEHGGRPQVIVSATTKIRAYDLASGKVVWECGGLSRNVVASPVAGNGIVYAANSYDWQAMMAIRLEGAKGDITGSDHVLWTLNRLTPYVPSPLLYGDTLYFLRHNQGVLSALDGKTGQPRGGPFRLNGMFDIFASPVGAASRVYITARNGATLVFSHGENSRALALNRLDDNFSASAALAGDELYLRGRRSLYCIAKD